MANDGKFNAALLELAEAIANDTTIEADTRLTLLEMITNVSTAYFDDTTEAVSRAVISIRAALGVPTQADFARGVKLCQWCGVNPVDDLRRKCESCRG